MRMIPAIFDHLKDKQITFDWKAFKVKATRRLDIEGELAQVLAAEIRKEIDNEILKEIHKSLQVPKDLL